MEGGKHMAAHFHDEQRNGQGKSYQQRLLQALDRFCELLAWVGLLRGRSIVNPFSRVAVFAEQGSQGGKVRSCMLDTCLAGGQVDFGTDDARKGADLFFNAAHTGGTGHALDGKLGLLRLWLKTQILNSAKQAGGSLLPIVSNICPSGGQIDIDFTDAGHRRQLALDTADTGRTGHAFDRNFKVVGAGHGDLQSSNSDGINGKACHHGKVKKLCNSAHSREPCLSYAFSFKGGQVYLTALK